MSARGAWPFWLGAGLVTLAASWLPLAPLLQPLLRGAVLAQLQDPRIQQLLGRTLWMSAAAAGLALALGLPLAVLGFRLRVPGAAFFALLLPLPLFVPPLLIAQAWHGLSGMDGIHAAWLTLGGCYAPFPALFASRALLRQTPSQHEAALLCGGPRFALREMLGTALPAASFGASLAFLFAATDFAVPDYFAWVGDKFSVYAAEVFNRWRDQDYRSGAAAAAPVVLAGAAAFYAALALRDRRAAAEPTPARPPQRLDLGRYAWPCCLLGWTLCAALLLVPLGRIVYETGMAGPRGTGSWWLRCQAAFRDALERGRGDLLRSLASGAGAAVLVFAVAPIWAHFFAAGRPSFVKRLLAVLLALPLLAPAMGLGLGAILAYNRELFGGFYDGPFLPPLILAGRFLPVAVFLLAERLQRLPASQEEAALLAGSGYAARLFRYRLGPQRPAWWLCAGLTASLAMRELDLAILLPAANASAVVRYYNALHFGRDNFVAAFGLLMAAVLFLPLMLRAAWRGLGAAEDAA